MVLASLSFSAWLVSRPPIVPTTITVESGTIPLRFARFTQFQEVLPRQGHLVVPSLPWPPEPRVRP